jgi:hypothetical protein
VAVVVDPIQSVKGKVVIDAFRTINPQLTQILKQEPRITTSNVGHLNRPSVQVCRLFSLLLPFILFYFICIYFRFFRFF